MNSDDTAAEATLASPVTASGSDIFIPLDMLTAGNNYLVTIIKACPQTGLGIVAYTGDGTTRDVAHNQGVKPRMLYVRNRDAASDGSMYWEDLGAEYRLDLAHANPKAFGLWGSKEPTSTHFTVANYPNSNAAGSKYIAFLFADSELMKVFQYTGNGSADGAYVDLGGSPAIIQMCKASNATANFYEISSVQNESKPVNKYMIADTNSIDLTGALWTFVSRGLKCIDTNLLCNGSGQFYVGLAIINFTQFRNAY